MTVWRPVPHNPKYSVSDDGRVRRHPWRELTQQETPTGYLVASLSGDPGPSRVHRLVAAAFIQNPHGYPVVEHIDHNRQNNHVANLGWCTQAMNLARSRADNRMPQKATGVPSPRKGRPDMKRRGTPAHNRKLSDETVAAIRAARVAENLGYRKLSRAFNVNKRTIVQIIKGEFYASPAGS